MKFFVACLCAVTLLLGMAATSNGAYIDDSNYTAENTSVPTEFDPNFSTYFYGFGDEIPGTGYFTDIDTGGYLTVGSLGEVQFTFKDRFQELSDNYYSDSVEMVISFSFSEDALALGMSFVTNTDDIALNLYANKGDPSPVDSHALLNASGFIGIVSDKVFKYATIAIGTGTALYIDDIKYQIVPAPVSILLLGSGLIGLVGLKRKFKK